ncbi:MAG: hypothetical protein H6555_00490 [Lewinellaceae bacterium]|nr:hypothetical protein [Lewinellaceae bacterium]
MDKQDRQEIDELFQRSAEQYPFTANPEAWRLMEAKLDRHRRRRVLFWWWLGAVAVLLGVIACWYGLSTRNTIPENQSLPGQKEERIQASVNPANRELQPDSLVAGIDSREKNASGVNPNPGVFTYPKETTITGNVQNKHITSINPSGPVPGSQSESRPDLIPVAAVQSVLPGEEIAGLPQQGTTAPYSIPTNPGEAGFSAREPIYLEGLPAAMPVLTYQSSREKEKDTQLKVSAPQVLAYNIPSSHPSPMRLWVGLTAQAKLNSVGWGDFNRPGLNAGLLLEVSAGKHWSFAAGGLLSREWYVAGANEFSPPRGSWPGVPPTRTIGVCSMIETPLSIAYYQRPLGGGAGWTGRLGIANWFMLNERYDYQYPYGSGNQTKRWSSSQDSQFWWSSIDLGVGYVFQLNSRINFQSELFSKQSLAGVGRGKVDLQSFGVRIVMRRSVF